MLLYLGLALLLLRQASSVESQPPQVAEVCLTRVRVGITISPLLGTHPPRQMRLWWVNGTPGDQICLYTGDPQQRIKPIFCEKIASAEGQLTTGVQAPSPLTQRTHFLSECQEYWVGHWSNGSLSAKNCLTTAPRWMQEMEGEIRRRSLPQLFIPGSHHSGSYETAVKGLVRSDWVYFHQEETVLGQLISGARYLDIRVTKLPDGNFYTQHSKTLYLLSDVLLQVKYFMEETREIVILDISSYRRQMVVMPYASAVAAKIYHRDLHALLQKMLGAHMTPALGWDATLQDIWDTGKRLVVSYQDEDSARRYGLWHGLTKAQIMDRPCHRKTLPELLQFLGKLADNPPPGPWSVDAVLTPTSCSVAGEVFLDGLSTRELANEVDQKVSEVYRGDWGRAANIVTVDYFRSSSIVDDAIYWNYRRALCS